MDSKNSSNTPADPADLSAREQILKVATRLFAENGFEGTSVRDISKECGLNLSLISYYFGGKEGLYQTILREHIQSVRSQVNLDFEKIPKLSKEVIKQEIFRLVSTIVDIKINSSHISLIMQREHLAGMPHAREMHEEMIGPMSEKWIRMVERAQEEGLLRKNIDAQSFFILMMQSIWGYFLMQDCNLSSMKGRYVLPQDKEEFKKFVINVFLEGIFI